MVKRAPGPDPHPLDFNDSEKVRNRDHARRKIERPHGDGHSGGYAIGPYEPYRSPIMRAYSGNRVRS